MANLQNIDYQKINFWEVYKDTAYDVSLYFHHFYVMWDHIGKASALDHNPIGLIVL
jgi:hypothetical protein